MRAMGIDAGGYADPPRRNDADDSNAINVTPSVRADLHIRPRRAGNDPNAPQVHAGVSLSTIIQWFKIMTTNEYIRGVKQSGWPPFRKRVWQRGYWERIVRDEREAVQEPRLPATAADVAAHAAALPADRLTLRFLTPLRLFRSCGKQHYI
jgi:hypothetical protein